MRYLLATGIAVFALSLSGCKSFNPAISPIDNSSRVNNYNYYYGDGNTTINNNGAGYPPANKSEHTQQELKASSLSQATFGSPTAVVQLTGILLQLAQNSAGVIQPGTAQASPALPLAQWTQPAPHQSARCRG